MEDRRGTVTDASQSTTFRLYSSAAAPVTGVRHRDTRCLGAKAQSAGRPGGGHGKPLSFTFAAATRSPSVKTTTQSLYSTYTFPQDHPPPRDRQLPAPPARFSTTLADMFLALHASRCRSQKLTNRVVIITSLKHLRLDLLHKT